MHTRSSLAVEVVTTSLLSSATSTAVPTAIDLANYFPVGKREVKFLVAFVTSSTALGNAATVILEEATSTSTTAFTTIVDAAGAGGTYTLAANALSNVAEANLFVSKRYIRARYVGTTSTGGTIGIVVTAFPLVRAA